MKVWELLPGKQAVTYVQPGKLVKYPSPRLIEAVSAQWGVRRRVAVRAAGW